MPKLPPEALAAIKTGIASGQFTLPILCQMYGIGEEEAIKLAHSLGVGKGWFKTSERLEIIKRHRAGESQHTIARELKMCRKKVRAILKSFASGAKP